MATFYHRDGTPFEVGEGTSDFGVTAYELFMDNDNVSARQGILTYQGKRLYPYNYPEQRTVVIKMYGGKIGLFIGDSYTAMASSYVTAFCERHGLIADNQGLASSTIAGSEDKITVGYHAFWVRLNEVLEEYRNGKEIDGVTYYLEDIAFIHIMGGANDWSATNSELNRLGSGANETNKETLYGALNYIFATCLSECPKADIIVTLQPVNYAQTVPTTEEGAINTGFDSLAQVQGMTDAQFSSYMMMRKELIVREMAERYGLVINDCCFKWFNPCNTEDAVTYWHPDKLHMAAPGNERLWNVDLEHTVNNIPYSRMA